MGCDIHMGVEVRDGGVWRICKEDLLPPDEWSAGMFDQYRGRHYDLFGALAAGVRRDRPNIGEPKGVPADRSLEYQEFVDSWAYDGHSHSWCTLAKCLDFGDWPEDGEWAALMKAAGDLGAPEDVRFVYFFDN